MDKQRERPPFSTISGTMVQLGDDDTVAVYRWNDLSWVAHFRHGCGELSDAATWFRAHAGWLRARRVGSAAVLESVATLPPEMVERIGELHRKRDAKAARRAAASIAAMGAFGQRLRQLASRLHGRRAGTTQRPG